MNTIDAAGVSFYRGLTISADGSVVPVSRYNCVSPSHEVVSSSMEKTADGIVVKFTLSSLAWGGDLRRPGWVQFVRGWSTLWPVKKHTRPSRLNLGPLCAEMFGRILRKSDVK